MTRLKQVKLTATEVQAAKLAGRSVTELAAAKRKYVRRKPSPVKTDWEKLAKRLQGALSTEIREHQETQKSLDSHIEIVAELLKKFIELKAIVKYLEEKADGNN